MFGQIGYFRYYTNALFASLKQKSHVHFKNCTEIKTKPFYVSRLLHVATKSVLARKSMTRMSYLKIQIWIGKKTNSL